MEPPRGQAPSCVDPCRVRARVSLGQLSGSAASPPCPDGQRVADAALSLSSDIGLHLPGRRPSSLWGRLLALFLVHFLFSIVFAFLKTLSLKFSSVVVFCTFWERPAPLMNFELAVFFFLFHVLVTPLPPPVSMNLRACFSTSTASPQPGR